MSGFCKGEVSHSSGLGKRCYWVLTQSEVGRAAEGILMVEPLSPLILEVKAGSFFIETHSGSKCGFVAAGGCATM